MKHKRRALFQSLISLLLCFSMLVGTTFAWFTDSVSSGKNLIAAGHLDIELEYLENGTWKKVDENTEVLDKNALWEPGYTEVAYLRISNVGPLALKYALGINIISETGSTNAAGEPFKLSDHIRFGVVESETEVTYADRVSARNALTTSKLIREGITTNDSLQQDDVRYAVLVVYMPEEVGNAANYATGATPPEIKLGIELVATQEVSENERDSFGSDYDAASEMPGFSFPDTSFGGNASVDVTTDDNNKVADGVTIEGTNTNAVIPAGVQLEEGTDKLTLEVSSMENSEANITLGENDTMRSLNVHVEGVAENNTQPMEITIKEAAAKGLNSGNLKLYHVENGTTVEMTLVTEFTAHNQFKYDPATGDITLYMATFSEVALVADTENAWNGDFDYSWYTNANARNTSVDYVIANADQLAAFGAIVGGMNGQTQDSFAGKAVNLISDVNLGDKEKENKENLIFYPIGYYNSTGSYGKTSGGSVTSSVSSFEGTFDGQGHKIENFYQNTWEMFGDYNDGYSAGSNYYKDAMGLFGYVLNGTVKNLTVSNFSSDGEYTPTGVIAAYADGNSNFENIAIVGCNPRVYNTGNGGIIGIAGDTSAANDDHITLKNITVDNSNIISALWGSYDVACGGLVGMYRGNVDGSGNATGDTISFENCHVAAQMDVYNDVCGNYQYYAYRYAGMIIGSIRHNTTTTVNGETKTIPNMTGISAKGCTVNYGTWNDYYYCEYVKNGHPSYSGPNDYKFSRVPNSEIDTSNGKENATCIGHNHKDAEDKQAVYLPFHQLFTGYSWGVSSIGLKEYSGIVTDLDITEGDQEKSVNKFETKFTGDFLYRVGNDNAISVSSLFAAAPKLDENGDELKDENGNTVYWDINDPGTYVRIDKKYDDADVTCTFTPAAEGKEWTEGTLKFEGTGVVDIVIQDYDYCTPTTLHLEVVDAYNRTTASFGGNSVLLNDVSTSSALSTSGVIYGNGFTVNMENAPISEKNGAVFHLYDGAILKNLNIVGKEFTTVAMNVNDTNYGVSAVRAWGTVLIENCYISGCRAPVSVTGTELTIKDSVIANGVYANIDFRSGILNLHNVTTINEPHSVNGTTIVGLGVVGNMTASAGRQLNISGTLTQYNWVSKADCANIKATGVDSIFESVFNDSKYANLRYTYNGTTYVNTGILSLCSDFGASAVTGIPSTYTGMDVTATISGVTVDGYVWAPGKAETLNPDDMKYHDAVYVPGSNDQGTAYIPPAFDFAAAGLIEENGVAQISYESGSSYTLTAETIGKLLTPVKFGQELPYTISMNGVDYPDKDIVFNSKESKTYTIVYTIKDNLVFDTNGNHLKDKTYEVTKELKVFATVVDKGADAPTFTFYYGTNGSASAGTPHTTQPTNSYTSTIKQVGENYYIMPNVSATTANAIGSQTVEGETVYYPIVDGINVRSGNAIDYDFTRYYPVFKAMKISDNGTEYSYSGTKELPATISWVSATIDSGNGASALNDGFGLYNNQYLCKIQKKAGDAESGGTSVVKFSYTALDGKTYYYYVGFRFYDESEKSGCVTADSLVMLSDGTQKRVDQLTYQDELLVWDFYRGSYTSAPIAVIVNHGDAVYDVINMHFSDGTIVRIINEHDFFDVEINDFVCITEENVELYLGHSFVKMNGAEYTTVTLEDVVITNEMSGNYSLLTAQHFNCMVEGMLSLTPDPSDQYEKYLHRFAVGENLKYDEEKMKADVEKYGLYTYEDFSEYATYEQFVAFDPGYLKIYVGKGYITFEDIIAAFNFWI